MELQPARAREIVSSFEKRRVLVLGDVMLDRFIWGEVSRISPEAPVPVVRVRRESVHLGGAANVAANLASLGARVSIAGIVGADPSGKELRSSLEAAGIRSVLEEDAARATTVKTRVIARAQQVVRVDRENDGPVEGAVLDALLPRILEEMARTDALVVSDYDKGMLSPSLLDAVLPRAWEAGLPVVVDPKLPHFRLFRGVTVITPNQSEAARATAMEIRSDEDCLAAARAILGQLDAEAVLITRGERGMLLLEREADPVAIAAVAREVYDVTGAGDTVVAVLALALAAGAELREASVLANHAGGIVVGKVGTGTVSAPELLASLES